MGSSGFEAAIEATDKGGDDGDEGGDDKDDMDSGDMEDGDDGDTDDVDSALADKLGVMNPAPAADFRSLSSAVS